MTKDRWKTKLFVWDVPTRLFHWSLVALVALSWVTGDEEGVYFVVHQLSGYGIFIAVLFRVVWGFAGSRHSLFRDFLRPWPVVRDCARRLVTLKPPASLGHNPLGGWMIVAMLATLLAQLATGAFAREDELMGPLAEFVSPDAGHAVAEIHEGLANALLALIALHVAGVAVDVVLTRDNLVRAMWTGYKTVEPQVARREAAVAVAPYWRAAVALAAASAVAWTVAML
jgi:cytochrome b